MNSIVKILSFYSITAAIVLFICVSSTGAAKQLPCNNDTVKHVDRIISKINPIGNQEAEFPQTIPEAQKWCKTLIRPINTLDDLNKRCIKGMMKEVVGIVLYSVKKKRKSICKKTPGVEMKDLVDSGKCVNKARFQLEKCANKSLDRFSAMKNVDSNLKIPLVCCEIAMAKSCMVEAMDKDPTCTDKNANTLLNHFDGLSGGALKIACNDYQEGGEKCNKLKSIKLQVKPGQSRHKSLVLPVIQLFESIDNNSN